MPGPSHYYLLNSFELTRQLEVMPFWFHNNLFNIVFAWILGINRSFLMTPKVKFRFFLTFFQSNANFIRISVCVTFLSTEFSTNLRVFYFKSRDVSCVAYFVEADFFKPVGVSSFLCLFCTNNLQPLQRFELSQNLQYFRKNLKRNHNYWFWKHLTCSDNNDTVLF